MLELEVKVLNIDIKDMERRLMKIGAEFIDKEEQSNIIIDSEDNYIQEELNSYLRIRKTKSTVDGSEKICMTLKQQGKTENLRRSIETTTEIKNEESMIKIMGAIGLNVVERGYKERISYRYGGIRFDLDTWDEETYPESYMEIEVNREEDLEKAIELLDLNREDITRKSIVELQEELED